MDVVGRLNFDRMALQKRLEMSASLGLAALSRSAQRPRQRLVFTVTNGRSGSDMLHRLFTAFDHVAARHEPKPDFRHLRPLVAHYPKLGRIWLEKVKLPAIARCSGDVYVETSHMFCKGYLEPMLDLGLGFDLIFLKRPARDIARSMARLPAAPGAGPWARSYYVSPSEPNFLPRLPGGRLSRYQLCFWHALENEARQVHYERLAKEKGLNTYTFHTAELGDKAAVLRLFQAMRLDLAKLDFGKLDQLVLRKVNAKTDRKKPLDQDVSELTRQENELRAMIGLGEVW